MTYAPNLRTPPRGIGRWMARAPRYLYRMGLGRLLGRRFVLVEHRGRRSGSIRQTVLEVIEADDLSLYVAAAWGANSDWFKNIAAEPSVVVSSGPIRHSPAAATVLSRSEAAAVFERYVAGHPTSARALSKALQLPLDDSAAMADIVPVVRLTLDRTNSRRHIMEDNR